MDFHQKDVFIYLFIYCLSYVVLLKELQTYLEKQNMPVSFGAVTQDGDCRQWEEGCTTKSQPLLIHWLESWSSTFPQEPKYLSS